MSCLLYPARSRSTLLGSRLWGAAHLGAPDEDQAPVQLGKPVRFRRAPQPAILLRPAKSILVQAASYWRPTCRVGRCPRRPLPHLGRIKCLASRETPLAKRVVADDLLQWLPGSGLRPGNRIAHSHSQPCCPIPRDGQAPFQLGFVQSSYPASTEALFYGRQAEVVQRYREIHVTKAADFTRRPAQVRLQCLAGGYVELSVCIVAGGGLALGTASHDDDRSLCDPLLRIDPAIWPGIVTRSSHLCPLFLVSHDDEPPGLTVAG